MQRGEDVNFERLGKVRQERYWFGRRKHGCRLASIGRTWPNRHYLLWRAHAVPAFSVSILPLWCDECAIRPEINTGLSSKNLPSFTASTRRPLRRDECAIGHRTAQP